MDPKPERLRQQKLNLEPDYTEDISQLMRTIMKRQEEEFWRSNGLKGEGK